LTHSRRSKESMHGVRKTTGDDNGNVAIGRQHAGRWKARERMALGVRVSGAMLPPHVHGVPKSRTRSRFRFQTRTRTRPVPPGHGADAVLAPARPTLARLGLIGLRGHNI
jgi:hypothetical protein